MSALDEGRDRFVASYRDFAAGLGDEPAWLRRQREEAIAAFAEQGLPSTRLEEWRYTNLSRVARTPFEAPEQPGAPVSRAEVEEISSPVFACSLFVFVDGRFEPKLSALGPVGGLRVESLAALRAEAPERLEPHLGGLIDAKRHPFAALNTAFGDDGAALFVPEGTVVDEPIHVVFLSRDSATPRVRHPRLLLVAGRNSRVSVIQDHVCVGEGVALDNAVSEVWLGENAGVDLILLQRESRETTCISNVAARLARDARFASHTLTFGGRLVRNDLSVLLADEGADCTLNGLFVGEGEQVIDNHTLVDHAVPHGTSRQLYKGILGGASRGVFRGRVVVRPDAQKTNAQQSNPNLLLDDRAEIDTRPQLEIYADDVKCSHGSSIGQLDEDSLFYLRSRGIEVEAARQILTRAFAVEILRALPISTLADGLDDLLLERLQGAPA